MWQVGGLGSGKGCSLSLKVVFWQKFSLGDGQSLFFKVPTDRVRPINIMVGNLLYSKSTDLNVNLIQVNTFTETSTIMFDQYLGTMAQPTWCIKWTIKWTKKAWAGFQLSFTSFVRYSCAESKMATSHNGMVWWYHFRPCQYLWRPQPGISRLINGQAALHLDMNSCLFQRGRAELW